MNDSKPEVIVLAEMVAQWCLNRSAAGDVDTDTLVDNFAKIVKKVIVGVKH
jgi:hypothetical protein